MLGSTPAILLPLARSGGQDGGRDRERRGGAETGVVDHRAARSGEDRLM